ncbi:choice-of-anchor I family protein [Metabacillus halosaccharovorans]|uniref:choice-of-anchor I family protein n=1 Tax=Metabacillus halosaccharovorans TaxID=930124 RepID=UPI001C1FC2A0|nr:choice-of-anchor I family protein [Metabacillus halosaccharovorans]MBU7593093.1 LPXTG cell wall anchor domain-containing protein [Metabacillus halosaccharovorans]
MKFQHFMSKTIFAAAASCVLLLSPVQTSSANHVMKFDGENGQGVHVQLLGRYSSGAGIGEGGTEIVAYDSISNHAFSVNGSAKAVDIIDLNVLKDSQEIPRLKQINLKDLGVAASDVTSVAIHPEGGYIAVSAPAANKVDPGFVVFLSTEGDYLSHVTVGALPDMLTFTPDGSYVLVANEGEPSDDYQTNPEGSVSMIDVSNDVEGIKNDSVTPIEFVEDVIEEGVRKVSETSTFAQDLEPEYIVVDEESKYAFVALQENNAMAKLDLQAKRFVQVKSLGYKDFSIGKNKLDASNEDNEINITNWPVLSMYQPDGMATYKVNGQTYILSANEGDAQDYDGFSEEERVADLKESYELNADLYEGYTQEQLNQLIENGLFNEEQVGRLNTTISAPKNDNGKYEAIYGYGARSFSIWNANTLDLTYDSGSDFEEITKQVYGEDNFNSNNDENNFDSRSDDKGPEPETVTIGHVQGQNYAFIGLERVGGIMVYNIDNPEKPVFNRYFSSRVFNGEEKVTVANGDTAPEGLTFIPADESPTGQNILLAAHEVSGTIAAYQIGIEVKEEEIENPIEPVDEVQPETEIPNVNQQPTTDEDPLEHSDDEKVDNNDQEEQEATENKEEVRQNDQVLPEQQVTIELDKTEKSESENGYFLPNTATNNFVILLLGIVCVIVGLGLVVKKKFVVKVGK